MPEAPALDTALLRTASAELGVPLSDDQVELFERYAALLVQWNARVNLTSVDDPAGIAIRHFADSLAVAAIWQPAGPARAVDVGTGAGLPGLALKILWPRLQLTLVESVGKKAVFVDAVVRDLGLAGVSILAERAEDAAARPDQRERYDLALARAVAPLAVLAELTLPFCRVGGALIVHKSGDIATEVAAAGHAIATLGGDRTTITPVALPALAGHVLVRVEKVRPTPAEYPRRAGTPARRPL